MGKRKKEPVQNKFHLAGDLVNKQARANMENCYQNSSWGKVLIKSRNNESYTFVVWLLEQNLNNFYETVLTINTFWR
jgi:hypothetical protein